MRIKRTIAAVAIVALLGLLLIQSDAGAHTPTGPSNQGGVSVAGDVPPLLQYQGRLTDPGTGEPVDDGSYTMVFRLYDVESGGDWLWSETKDVSVEGGVFSTTLGDTEALDPGLFSGQALWLGIKVGADAEATPRQRLLPVAYALGLAPGAVISTTSTSAAFVVSNAGAGDALQVDGTTTLNGDLSVSGSLIGGSHEHSGGDITSGTVAEPRIAAQIARDTEIMPTVLGNDGVGSSLDADRLDGQDSSAFSPANHTHSGSDITSGTVAEPRIAAQIARDAELEGAITGHAGDADAHHERYTDNEAWGAVLARDGAGTGLHADLLDGRHAGDFALEGHHHDSRYVNTTGPDSMSGSSADPILDVKQTGSGVGGNFSSVTTYGVFGETSSTSPGQAGIAGVAGWTTFTYVEEAGVLGKSKNGTGVVGHSDNHFGVYGRSETKHGVRGEAMGTTAGVFGGNWGTGYGVRGYSLANHGVYGYSGSSTDYGGYFSGYNGLYARGTSGNGIYAEGANTGQSGAAILAENTGAGVGLWGKGNWGLVADATGDGVYAGFFYDDIYVSGKIDVIGTVDPIIGERFEVHPDGEYEVGDLLVIDPDSPYLVLSTEANDTKVIGVVGPSVDYRDGELMVIVLGYHGAKPDESLDEGSARTVARIKVDASQGAIKRGDLLTTSPTPGHAMKAQPVDVGGVEIHRPGTIIGKALESLDSGQGLIEVFIALQ
jgi:hypothetical protein